MLPRIYDDDASDGVKHDQLVEALNEVGGARHQLREMYVDLDTICDTREGIWTDSELTELRNIQRALSEIADSKGDDMADIREELDSLVEDADG